MPDTAEEFLPEKAVVTVDRVVGLCHLGVWPEVSFFQKYFIIADFTDPM